MRVPEAPVNPGVAEASRSRRPCCQWLLRTLAFGIGRPFARFITFFVALYFMIRRGPERAASRVYLERVLGRRAGWLDVYRHFLCFSTVTLDRVYLMADQFERFDVRIFGIDQLRGDARRGRGVLLLSAHLGSFDALRVLSLRSPDMLDPDPARRGPERGSVRVLNTLNPKLAATIIDARRPGPELVLEMQNTLERNGVVSTLADRMRPGKSGHHRRLPRRTGRLPSLALAVRERLHVPVVLAFGLYRGGKRYDLHFERFDFEVPRDRRERTAALAHVVQRFADRLAHFARQAPYNWFNLYDFWDAPFAPNDPPGRTAADGHGIGSQP